MSDILCMYYSRTGNTKKAMTEIADALGAELVALDDGVDRSGWKGWLRSGLDAMRKTTQPIVPIETKRPLKDYRLVILGTPVWAGRCSSVVRTFLKTHGSELKSLAYVLTRGGKDKHEEVFDQMDYYAGENHHTAVSLRSGSVGVDFWQEEFLRQIRDFLGSADS